MFVNEHSYNKNTYGHFFFVCLDFVPVSIELTHHPFGVRIAPVRSINVPVMTLVTYSGGGSILYLTDIPTSGCILLLY